MKSEEIRQSFLDFFESKKHQVVKSASLLPESPNLLFTNAGMNQFVPYFLGDQQSPFTRAADTQKCIRAGGKHNDLEDVGFDTYHHTFFEMLGNWSFGDYFKEKAIKWSWELLVDVWKFPPQRLYASVYKPEKGDPAEFDQEAYDVWEEIFLKAGLDPQTHIVTGGKQDNFWMMGETGPCGPCSELHLDLTETGDSNGSLVNADSHLCIEIWNLVFIQFNADRDGNFSPLAAQHVDTGMGFERVAAVMQATKNFSDFSKPASNYDTDVFSSIFTKISELSGKTYQSTLPLDGKPANKQEETDIAFRVIGDHLRALCFSIADGILPGNNDRNYVLRRILRRGIRYGRVLGFDKPFFHVLASTLIEQMGNFFPELKSRQVLIEKTLLSEEESFNRTLDRGIEIFNNEVENLQGVDQISGTFAFKLYDTYGFPLDLTELMARELNLSVKVEEFEAEMTSQRERARQAHKSTDIIVSENNDSADQTEFCGYNPKNFKDFSANCVDSFAKDEKIYLALDRTPFYAEMGGQVGDSGSLFIDGTSFRVSNVIKDNTNRFLHCLESVPTGFNFEGQQAIVNLDIERRRAIQRHHTATHILHWALREVLGDHIRQAGSLVQPDRLRFDFSHFEGIKPDELAEISRIANQKILANDHVKSYEIPFSEKPEGVIAFFGDKYGEIVRVVDLGGWSQELCGGTHVSSAGEVGFLHIVSESAISAGTRRIEAVAGNSAFEWANERIALVQNLSRQLACLPSELEERINHIGSKVKDYEKKLKSIEQKGQAGIASELISKAEKLGEFQIVKAMVPELNPNDLRALVAQINKKTDPSIVLLASNHKDKCSMVCICSNTAVEAGHHAGKYLGELSSAIGGKGGGKPDFAMGGAPACQTLHNAIQGIAFVIS